MKLIRNENHEIVTLNELGEEIHPFISILAAIEMQLRIVPPRIPALTSQGWHVTMEALELAIDTLGNETAPAVNPVTVEDVQQAIAELGTNVQTEQRPTLKTKPVR